MNKTRKKNANWIYQILLILMVVAIAYHMFSYFLRLVYPSNQAAVEFQKVMELVRGQEFSLDHWLYIPIALITKMFSVFFGGVKIYKGFILAEVFVNVLVVLLLYEVNIRIFGMKIDFTVTAHIIILTGSQRYTYTSSETVITVTELLQNRRVKTRVNR